MAVYYVASKLSIVACSTHCISRRRRRNKCQSNKSERDKSNVKSDDDDTDGANTDDWKRGREVRTSFRSLYLMRNICR